MFQFTRFLPLVLSVVLTLFCLVGKAVEQNVEDGFKMVNGVNHYYKVLGQGEPIVMLHGGPGMFHDYFMPHIEPLSQDFQLIFYDQRGNGQSKATLTAANFTIDQLVEDLEGMRKAFGLAQMTLFGHSWGGLLALHYGIKYPQRVKRLILSNPAPADSGNFTKMLETRMSRYTPANLAQMEQIMQDSAFQNGDSKAFQTLVSLAEQVNVYDTSKMDFILSGMVYDHDRVINAMTISGLKNSFFENYDIRPALNKISAKTLVIHGDGDSIPLASDEGIVKALPNAQLVRLDHSGHYPFAEQPQPYFVAIKQFLAK